MKGAVVAIDSRGLSHTTSGDKTGGSDGIWRSNEWQVHGNMTLQISIQPNLVTGKKSPQVSL